MRTKNDKAEHKEKKIYWRMAVPGEKKKKTWDTHYR